MYCDCEAVTGGVEERCRREEFGLEEAVLRDVAAIA
jgi:hypothetical protein